MSQYLDNPEADNTPQAHPAFHRGKKSGIEDVVSIVNRVVSGSDNGSGQVISPVVENMRQNVLTLKRQATEYLNTTPTTSSYADTFLRFCNDVLQDKESQQKYEFNAEYAKLAKAFLQWKNALSDMSTKTGYLAKKADAVLCATIEGRTPKEVKEDSVEN